MFSFFFLFKFYQNYQNYLNFTIFSHIKIINFQNQTMNETVKNFRLKLSKK